MSNYDLQRGITFQPEPGDRDRYSLGREAVNNVVQDRVEANGAKGNLSKGLEHIGAIAGRTLSGAVLGAAMESNGGATAGAITGAVMGLTSIIKNCISPRYKIVEELENVLDERDALQINRGQRSNSGEKASIIVSNMFNRGWQNILIGAAAPIYTTLTGGTGIAIALGTEFLAAFGNYCKRERIASETEEEIVTNFEDASVTGTDGTINVSYSIEDPTPQDLMRHDAQCMALQVRRPELPKPDNYASARELYFGDEDFSIGDMSEQIRGDPEEQTRSEEEMAREDRPSPERLLLPPGNDSAQ